MALMKAGAQGLLTPARDLALHGGAGRKAGSESRAPILPGQGAENFASVFVVFVRVENAAQKLACLVHFATQSVINARGQRKLHVTLVIGAIVFLENLLGFA